ncbi:hypothetical protein [Flavobacterium soyangense]|uniref:Uncharacterized protein n=1 Tax=Flavobacterium soyangense TaxID=2023265 RepID=A0A930Y0H5_9FLAO|nr:hypothetical protein [Flavobacterium soyangense]MBF2709953.1 hypothetical protein [Flavobacterium soyangense]
MKKERILISQDNSLLDSICSDLRHFKPLLENLKTIYESLEIGPFTPQIYGEIVYSGTGEISKRFRASIEADIKKMGVSKSIIKDNITSGAETLLNQFVVYVNELKRFRPDTFSREQKLNLKCISLNEKGFVITSDDKEDILESQCRIYIETDEEHELYNALLKFIEAFDNFDKNIVELGITTNPYANKLGSVAEMFLIPENGKYKVKPESIRWAINRKNLLKSNKGNH